MNEGEPTGLWRRLRTGLERTRGQLAQRIGAAIEGRGVADPQTLEELEEALIAADLGVETSLELVERVRGGLRPGELGDAARLRELLLDEISILLLDAPAPPPTPEGPTLTLVVGVNGVGKTTTIAKLARLSQRRGRTPILAAGDTFRAAAIDQLVVWGERLGIDVIRQRPGGDPAAVVYDAIHAARARGADDLIVDTAGRLHTKKNLMAELAKIGRVVEREGGHLSRRTLLVLDATGGHNALQQAREFDQAVALDGIVLAKVDGTAKGGIVVALARDLRLPVTHLGVGEGADDLVPFVPRDFARALLS
ncbi:MAG: signal recognition particle-docking protein FtsY [Thermoanaerobaculia bacterium]|nr:signal recognition particle-docking protein FtsY [Thermoanaerobaculia bacterium]